ncbi:MAG: LapA family protein [Gammaproteobacteria bacterium]
MGGLKRVITRIVLAFLVIAAFILATENSDAVSLKLLHLETEAWPVSWWMVLSFFLGVLIGQLISNVNRWVARKSDDTKTPG